VWGDRERERERGEGRVHTRIYAETLRLCMHSGNLEILHAVWIDTILLTAAADSDAAVGVGPEEGEAVGLPGGAEPAREPPLQFLRSF
jgi:hypothetical protein